MREGTNILRRVLRDDDVSSSLHAVSAAAVNSANPRVAHTLSLPLRSRLLLNDVWAAN